MGGLLAMFAGPTAVLIFKSIGIPGLVMVALNFKFKLPKDTEKKDLIDRVPDKVKPLMGVGVTAVVAFVWHIVTGQVVDTTTLQQAFKDAGVDSGTQGPATVFFYEIYNKFYAPETPKQG